jgi:hypothetical protein
MKKKETEQFTNEEILFIKNILAQQTVNPMAPNAIEIVQRVQGIVRKMEANKEQQDGK